MKKRIVFALILLLCPTIGLTGHYDQPTRYGNRSYGPHSYPPPSSGVRHRGYYPQDSSYHHHNDWIVPLAIFGAALGVMALSQPYVAPPAPPQRICRDTYNYYDEYGRYLYSEYVDRPCN